MRYRRTLATISALFALVAVLLLAPATAFAAGTTLTFSDDGITETEAGSGYAIDGTTLTVSSAGTYTLTGSCSEGAVVVAKSASGVTLVLDNLTLTSSSTAPIVVKKDATVALHLEGTSTLTDNEDPANETSSDATVADAFEGACVKVKSGSTVTFCGEGDLACVANAKNGIKGGATASLIFNQAGTITVSGSYAGHATSAGAVNNGIACDGSLTFNQGSYVIAAANDGIKSAPDATDETAGTTVDADSAGTVTINGGLFDIDVDGDGIQADTALTINGGIVGVKTYEGYSAWNDTLSASLSCKGLKASGDRATELGLEPALVITGGTFSLDCGDDAVHSDADITVTGGTFGIWTGDDGMHADGTLTLGTEGSSIARDPDVTVEASYEGLEGSTVYVYSGRYRVTASDDGVNAAGGSSNGSDPGHGGGFWPGGGWPGSSAGSSEYNLYVYGGDLYVDCQGDGLDSNGGIYLRGGTQAVFSMAAGGDNSPIDADGTIVIDGATVFTAGTAGMNGRARQSWFGSNQPYKDATTTFAAGSIVDASADGEALLSYQLPRRANYVMASWPGTVSDSQPTIAAAEEIAPCKGGSRSHSWDAGVASVPATVGGTGHFTYTCQECGATETQTIPALVEVPVCDHDQPVVEDEGYAVTFEVGEGASVNVYYTQDYTTADETGVTSTVSRNATTGAPDSTGEGQVNFTIVLEDGYELDGDPAVEGSYKNLKDVSTDELPHTWRVTKVAGELVVSVATTKTEPEPDPEPEVKDISEATVSAATTCYTGSAVTPAPVVTLDGTTLEAGTDYTVKGYRNNVNPGTATVTVEGTGAYTGTASGTFVVDEPFVDVKTTTSHYRHVLWLYASGITKGWGDYPAREYRGLKAIARCDMAAFLCRYAGVSDYEPTEEDIAYFSDVTWSTDHCREIWWLAHEGITKGWTEKDGSHTFRPYKDIARADMAAFLYRLAGVESYEPTEADKTFFVDIDDSVAHCDEVWWLASLGISTGWPEDDGTRTFRPYNAVARLDMAAFLHRLYNSLNS